MAYESAKQLRDQVALDQVIVERGSDGVGPSTSSGGGGASGAGGGFQMVTRNPLICCICQDYFNEPCLMQCYHTFCARCLRGRDCDGKMACPICGHVTQLRESPLPPPDLLMSQLIELANSENPPCSNCDVRDRNNMYYCSTCSQALCNHCRENTHRAKMFSTHDVVHMSKCAKEPKKCPMHGEQYIMFSTAQKTMLCVNCFRDTAAEQRSFCVDIDTAYSQATKRLDRAQGGLNELQNSIRDGLIMFKNQMDELRQNMDSEKHIINTFCQGMQEAIAKTHANMIMEVQRQFETKEKVFRSQIVTLGTVLPTLQQHLVLCVTFANSANKFQFLELAYIMFDRLNAVSQMSHPLRPVQSSAIRTNYRNEFAQSLEPWIGKSVMNAVDSSGNIYESSIGLQQTISGVQPQPSTSTAPPSTVTNKKQQNILKMKLLEDESPFSNHCRTFETQIKDLCRQLTGVKERLGELHRDITILRRENVPPLNMRYECVTRDCSLLDENLERHQNDLDRMKVIFDSLWEEQLCRIHIEQDIFHSQITDIMTLRNELKHLSSVAQQLEAYIKTIQTSSQQQQHSADDGVTSGTGAATTSTNVVQHQQHLQELLEQIGLLQLEKYLHSSVFLQLKTECKLHPTSDTKGDTIPVRESSSRQKSRSSETRPQVSAIQEPPTTLGPVDQQKRNVISQLIERVNRRKSPTDEHRCHSQCSSTSCTKDRERSKSTSSVQSQSASKEKGSKQGQKGTLQQPVATIERLETHIKEKLHDIINRRQSKLFEMVSQDSTISLPGSSSTTKIQKLQSGTPCDEKCPKSIEIQMDSLMQQEFASLVHRKLSKSDLEKLALLSHSTKVLDQSKKIGKSCDKINELKKIIQAGSGEGTSQQSQKVVHKRSKTPETCQRYRAKTPPDNVSTGQRSKTMDRTCERSRSRSKTPPDNARSQRRRQAPPLEADYQHIADATSSLSKTCDKSKYKQNRSTPSSPKSGSRKQKVYPFSDGEDAAEFYRKQKRSSECRDATDTASTQKHKRSERGSIKMKKSNSQQSGQSQRQNSFESLSTLSLNSRRSSLETAEKTLVLVIGARNKGSGSSKSLNKPSGSQQATEYKDMKHPQKSDKSGKRGDKGNDFSLKQRSWETFPPKKHRNQATRSYQYYQLPAMEKEQIQREMESKPPRFDRQQRQQLEFEIVDPTLQQAIASLKKQRMEQQHKRRTMPGSSSQAAGGTSTVVRQPAKRHGVQHHRQLIAERGYCSEYELDFDTDGQEEMDSRDSVFDFEDLTIDWRGKTSTNFGREFLTFKSDNPRAMTHMTTFKGSDSQRQMQHHQSSGSGYFKGDSSQSLAATYESNGSSATQSGGEGTLKKADSFEGHEEAVRTLVAAVQETRTAAARKQPK